MVKIKDLISAGAENLKDVADNPRNEARILLACAFYMQPHDVIIHMDEDASDPKKIERYEKYISERANHKPIAYITGDKAFFGLIFKVNEHTLIPRPETEMVVEEILSYAGDPFLGNEKTLLDLCTGSGCIPIAAAFSLCSNIKAHAVDISEGALEIAWYNARLHCVHGSVGFEKADIFEKSEFGKFDIISSNPPYITDADMLTLPPDVANFEPHTALAGGSDGLMFYRRIAEIAPKNLNPDGFIVLEIGIGEGNAVAQLLEKNFTDIKIKKDLAGIDRVVTARLRRT